jgi:hypothetical protein
MTRRKKGEIISEAFEIMELPIRFVTEVVNDFINDTVFFISGKRRSRVSTNY